MTAIMTLIVLVSNIQDVEAATSADTVTVIKTANISAPVPLVSITTTVLSHALAPQTQSASICEQFVGLQASVLAALKIVIVSGILVQFTAIRQQ